MQFDAHHTLFYIALIPFTNEARTNPDTGLELVVFETVEIHLDGDGTFTFTYIRIKLDKCTFKSSNIAGVPLVFLLFLLPHKSYGTAIAKPLGKKTIALFKLLLTDMIIGFQMGD